MHWENTLEMQLRNIRNAGKSTHLFFFFSILGNMWHLTLWRDSINVKNIGKPSAVPYTVGNIEKLTLKTRDSKKCGTASCTSSPFFAQKKIYTERDIFFENLTLWNFLYSYLILKNVSLSNFNFLFSGINSMVTNMTFSTLSDRAHWFRYIMPWLWFGYVEIILFLLQILLGKKADRSSQRK